MAPQPRRRNGIQDAPSCLQPLSPTRSPSSKGDVYAERLFATAPLFEM